MLMQLRAMLVLILVTCLITSVAYPLGIGIIGQLLLSEQSEGSLVRDAQGRVVGSRLIAQRFKQAGYFHPRPSAVDYNAAGSGGSNWSGSQPKLRERIVADLKDRAGEGTVSADAVLASGSGLDPHITVTSAIEQLPRVAAAHAKAGQDVTSKLKGWIDELAQTPLGSEPIVNVLELNRKVQELTGGR